MKANTLILAIVVMLIDVFGASRFASAASDSGTLTDGAFLACTAGSITDGKELLRGFASGLFGSYSPVGLTGGETVVSIFDRDFIVSGPICSGVSSSILVISGFSVNPGQNWLNSITCNGITNNGSAAIAFSYSSGSATWRWSQVFGLTPVSVSCTINH